MGIFSSPHRRVSVPGTSVPLLSNPDLRNMSQPRASGRPLTLDEIDYDDLVIHNAWREYDPSGEGQVKYFMYKLSQRNPGEAVYQSHYKAVRLLRLTRVPRYLRQMGNSGGAVFEQQRDVLAALREQGCLFLNVIAKAPDLPLVFAYGVQAVGSTAAEAQMRADESYAVLEGQLSGTYQQLMYSPLSLNEGESLAQYQAQWEHISMARGRPIPTGGSMGNAGLLDGNRTDVENANNQLESFIRGMGHRSFMLSLVTVPLSPENMSLAWRNMSKRLSDVRSDQQGARAVSAGIAVPLAMGGSHGSSYGNSHGVTSTDGMGASQGVSDGVSVGDTQSLSHGVNVGGSVSDSASVSDSQSVSRTTGVADSVIHGLTTSHGESLTEGRSLSLTEGTSQSDGQSQSLTDSASQSESVNTGVSQSQSLADSIAHGTTFGQSQSHSDSVGTSFGETQSQGTSVSKSDSVAQSVSHSQTASLTDAVSQSTAQGVNKGSSLAHGTSATAGWGDSFSKSVSDSLSQADGMSKSFNESLSQTLNAGNSHGGSSGSSTGSGTNEGVSGSVPGMGSSKGSSSQDSSQSGANWGSSAGHSAGGGSSATDGTSSTRTSGTSASANSGLNTSFGKGESLTGTNSVGSSLTDTIGRSLSESTGISVGQSASESVGITQGINNGHSLSQSLSQSNGASSGVSLAESASTGRTVGESVGASQAYGLAASTGQSAGQGVSQTVGQSVAQSTADSASRSTSASQSVSDTVGRTNSVSDSVSRGVSQTVGRTVGQSSGESLTAGASTSQTASQGTNAGLSMQQATSDAYQVAMARQAGTTSSLGVVPNVGISVSKQTFDEGKRVLGDLLDAQMRRYLEGVESGAFLYQMFFVTPDRETLVAGSGLLKSAFWGAGTADKRLPQPFHTVDRFAADDATHDAERRRLLLHARAFTSYRKREPVTELIEPFLYSSYVTPGEAAAFCHPPTSEASGLLAVHDSMPVLAMPANRGSRELYLGHVFNGERACRSDIRYGFDTGEVEHMLLTGVTGSGKTTSLMRLLTELSSIEKQVTLPVTRANPVPRTASSKASILALDWMRNMRNLARVVPPERFRMYSMTDPSLGEFRWNVLEVPADGMTAQEWLNTQADNFTAAFGLGDFGRSLIAEFLTDLYQANRLDDTVLLPEVRDPNTGALLRDAVILPALDESTIPPEAIRVNAGGERIANAFHYSPLSRCIGISHLAALVIAQMEAMASTEGARASGTAMRDRLQSLWRRLQYFAPGGQFADMLGYDETLEERTCLSVPDLVNADEGLVTVLETDGLDLPSRRLILGSVLLAVYRYGLFHGEGVFDHAGRGPGTWVVLEEAHELFGETARDEDATTVATRNAIYESMFRRARALGMHLIAVAQNPASLPSAVTSNISTVIVHNLQDQDDRLRAASMLNWANTPIGGNLREIRWLGELPRGHAVVKMVPRTSWLEAAPVNILVDSPDLRQVTNEELRELNS